ncbi:hypothetical protein CXB51_000154 [Gossypium anomalum]|uniref:non-specific serine/threonine protein kinase n=1 Tax=Gossypium anomalum TaxID=47600 RepID=A0A8J5Z4M6_9ROSI|nr:hypothetical protein CXB51_000154 [Gossypium anomalum]
MADLEKIISHEDCEGLLYQHLDSKLHIIHRDMKASNILLDGYMNPKFSEFDLARTFEGDDKVSETKRVIGTLRVQSPQSSMRSAPALLLWNEGRAMELVDPCLEDSIVESVVLRCIQVALICVQNLPKDRPTMSLVNFMLTNEEASLPFPKVPGFFSDTSSKTNTATRKKKKTPESVVLLLKIISGKKNRNFYNPDYHHNLLGHSLLVWNEENSLELLGTCLKDSIVESQVLRFEQVDLLCVQSFPEDRPTMSSVNFILANGDANLPHPKESGFFTEKSLNADIAASKNADIITMLRGR